MTTESSEHAQVDVNGIAVHTVSMGEGPLVVFCHGFPESWYSWRHQLPMVAEAGFRAMALDMRGYGGISAPAAVEAYSMSNIVAEWWEWSPRQERSRRSSWATTGAPLRPGTAR